MADLFDKYEVRKKDGTPVDPNAMYFVLRVDTDRHARVALRAYARSIRAIDSEFADALDRWLESRPAPPAPSADENAQKRVAKKRHDPGVVV